MRYLFVTWDGGGNLPPELAMARHLLQRGHQVRFLGHRSQEKAITRAGCDFSQFQRAPDCDASAPETDLIKDWEVKSPFALFARARDRLFFGPAADFAADVIDELGRHPADAVVVDWMLPGALVGAERSGLPTAAIWHSIYAPPNVRTVPFGSGFGLPRGRFGHLREAAVRAAARRLWETGLTRLNEARSGLGMHPLDSVFDQYDRAQRVLVATSPVFDFAALTGAELPPNVRYVGPQLEAPLPAVAETGLPLVLVSFSTTYQRQEALLRRVISALGRLPVRALVTSGPAVRLEESAPANVEVRAWTPHSQVMPSASLVVTHCGHGTVAASLLHGVPILCIPMGRDQRDVAARVLHAGAGRRVSTRASAGDVATAITTALADDDLLAAAQRLGRELRREILEDGAVRELEELTPYPR